MTTAILDRAVTDPAIQDRRGVAEHPAIDVRDPPRRTLARRGMACHVVQGPHHRCDWSNFLWPCMAGHERDAGEGINHEKAT